MTPLAVTVEFLSDGRCTISGSDVARKLQPTAAGARTLQPSDDAARRLQPSDPAGGSFRCPLPYAALGGQAIELRVVLPSGVAPADTTFPRLEWRQSGHDWIGTASLPASPAFVSLGRAPAPVAGDSFGWNFYGFFLFAAVFIAVYFAWARAMQHRAAAAR